MGRSQEKLVNYTIQTSRKANKIHSRIPSPYKENIKQIIEGLGLNPFPADCKKIKEVDNLYRVREGSYRIVYEVDPKALQVSIIYIDPRKDVYKSI
ncbi:MAG: hypothetical protein IEMM0008_1261 [bacterium]|nr:MAG: hypothetical protein IEMM0008_1261 [bacterium]